MAELGTSRSEKQGGIGRRGFLAMLGVGAAALGSLSFVTVRRATDKRKNAARILGVREDSVLMPRDKDIDRLLGG